MSSRRLQQLRGRRAVACDRQRLQRALQELAGQADQQSQRARLGHQLGPEPRVALGSRAPVQRRAHVRHHRGVPRQPGGRQRVAARVLGVRAREHVAHATRVARRDRLGFAGRHQLLACVGPRDEQQAIARRAPPSNSTSDFETRPSRRPARDGGKVGAARQVGGGFQFERGAERREPAQHAARVVVQQVVAPVKQRPQGLVPRQRRAAAAREKAEDVVEPRGQRRDAEAAHPRRCQFDGQRHAVEMAAHVHDVGDVGRRQREVVGARGRALDEQAQRRKPEGVGG